MAEVFRARAHGAMGFEKILVIKRILDTLAKDEEFKDGCSDRLVDAIVAWGSAEQIRSRIAAHHEAGATHVCILPLRADGKPLPDERATQALAPR